MQAFNDHSCSHVMQTRLEQSSSFSSLLAYMDEKSKGDRKIESVYVNRRFSVFPCLNRKWTQTWSTGISVSPPCAPPLLLPLRTPPWRGRAWQRATVRVVFVLSECVCVYVNFLFYRGSSVCMYRSFRFSLWEKKRKGQQHKIVSILMHLYGKRLALFLGSCPAL